VRDGCIVADHRDLLKLVVVERHRGTGTSGWAWSRIWLTGWSIATSVAHDSHNLIAVGADDSDLLCALQEIGRMREDGGLSGDMCSAPWLPIAGLMTSAPLSHVISDVEALHRHAQALGTSLSAPIHGTVVPGAPSDPELRLTDRGLVDVNRSCFVSLSVE
jgi:adenine deaminase